MMRERWLHTDSRLSSVLEQLKKREPIFHRPEFGTARADFERMMAEEFWEVGASGKRYSRAFVLEELERRYSGEYTDEWETSEFGCLQLAVNVYIVTYTLMQGKIRKTRRSTIWRHEGDGWKIVFHQGTVIQDE